MTDKSKTLDFGGLSLRVNEILTGYTKPSSSQSTTAQTFPGAVTITGALVGTPQTLTGAGAVNLTSLVTILVTTGANALTLADGTAGQIKIIVMLTDGGAGTLTPTNLAGGTTLTFDDVGDAAALVFNGTDWCVIGTPTATLA